MRLKNDAQAEAFLDAVNKCKAAVWLESPTGEKFDLKNKISQYAAMYALAHENGRELDVYCASPEDEHMLFEFFEAHPDAMQ